MKCAAHRGGVHSFECFWSHCHDLRDFCVVLPFEGLWEEKLWLLCVCPTHYACTCVVHKISPSAHCRAYYTSVKTHKMSFSARPLIQMNLLCVWKGGLKCTLLAWKIFFVKYKYFIINRQKTDFLRMCSVTVTQHIRKNTQKSKFLLSQAFKWKNKCFS